MSHRPIVVNTTILNSIPVDKDLKRYLISWFQRMCSCNGNNFAVSTVKSLRVLLQQYISDPNRLKKLRQYLSEAPIRKNHRLVQIFRYADSHPHAILALLKFYLGDVDPQTSVEESEAEMHQLLDSIRQEPSVPSDLEEWCKCLRLSRSKIRSRYLSALRSSDDPYHYVAKFHTLREWEAYWASWRGKLLGTASKEFRKSYSLAEAADKVPVPSMYSDYDPVSSTSSQFESDAQDFLGYFPDSRDGEETVPIDCLDWLLDSDEPDRVFNLFELEEIVDHLDPDHWYVGQIHHIPKKGTVVRRPIAVPNRFLQKGLAPYGLFLSRVLRALNRDHTFAQDKSMRLVKNRLDKGFYTCSVDLSHATDYLPKVVGDYIVDTIEPGFFKESDFNEDIIMSRKLFDFLCRAPWKNGEFLDQWHVGQPLGTLPSFGLLALEHNVLLESTALACGYLHSPYVVLGDDVLLFSKRMRKAYINLMNDLGVPLSLHKSFEHNLVEFAGQVFVKNQPVRYLPDPSRVTWYNLFDYSRNSGFLLSWRELPTSIKKKLSRQATKVALAGRKFYRLAAELYFAVYGSPYDAYMDYSMSVLPSYISILEEKSPSDVSLGTSGWAALTLLGLERLAYTGRGIHRIPQTQPWVRKKFKPCTTSSITANAMLAVKQFTAT